MQIIDGENLDEDWLHQELQTVNMIQYTPVQVVRLCLSWSSLERRLVNSFHVKHDRKTH